MNGPTLTSLLVDQCWTLFLKSPKQMLRISYVKKRATLDIDGHACPNSCFGHQKVTHNYNSPSKTAKQMCASSWTQRVPPEGPKHAQYVDCWAFLAAGMFAQNRQNVNMDMLLKRLIFQVTVQGLGTVWVDGWYPRKAKLRVGSRNVTTSRALGRKLGRGEQRGSPPAILHCRAPDSAARSRSWRRQNIRS